MNLLHDCMNIHDTCPVTMMPTKCMNDKIVNLKRHSFKQKNLGKVEFKFHVEIEVINNHILSSTTATSAEERTTTRGDTKTIHIFLSCLFSYKEYKYQRNTFYHCPIILKSINIPTHFVSLTSFPRVFTFKEN